ncbi:YceH family protein [Actinospongicola halichondriae]|uniref:YceH family protein n=1 Tax=Actinospongicola halichondriae TaxID=3236844 RepID=UPI003D5743B8
MDSFDAVERRVLGTLIEKEATVPDTYPLTLKSLVAGCNQKNNREPVTDLDSSTLQRTLDGLKARGVVRFVHPSHGARSTKYRHVLDEVLGLDRGELALVAVLFLRGPQTLSELRTRTERSHAFASLDETEATLEGLAGREEPLVVHLERQVGQKETRWADLLGGAADPIEAAAVESSSAHAPADLSARVAALESRLAAVESVLEELGVSPSSGND